MTETTRRGLAGVLAVHVGWDYGGPGVIECMCGWRSGRLGPEWNSRRDERHRAHVADALLAHLRAVAADEAVRERVARGVHEAGWTARINGRDEWRWERATQREQFAATQRTDAALDAFLDALDGRHGAAGGEVGPEGVTDGNGPENGAQGAERGNE